MIHRDLKPSNVIVSDDGRAIITDFGIARAASQRAHSTGMIGTPAYMSPEQASGAALDTRSDLYALGTILYELLSGRLPFDELDAIAAAMARLKGDPPDLRRLVALPAPLDLVMALLARHPDDRPGSTAEVRAALEACATGASRVATTTVRTRQQLSPGEHTLAVLPFRYRGTKEHDYLGAGVADELIDVLSRTRGLKVLASGAVARFADARDPLQLGAELGIDSLIDGQVRFDGGQLRLVVRLQDTKQGVQLWSDSVEVAVEGLFAVEERLAQRIAEALRLELTARPLGGQVPGEAVEAYLRARYSLRRGSIDDAERALDALENAQALAPGFQPPLAAHAMAAVRAWWRENTGEGGARLSRARDSVARAEEQAPDIAETHLARAMYEVQMAAYGEAVRAVSRALQIAPTASPRRISSSARSRARPAARASRSRACAWRSSSTPASTSPP